MPSIRRASRQLAVIAALAALVVACSSPGASPGMSTAPAPPSVAAPSAASSVAPVASVPVASARADLTFSSEAYRYRATIPADLAAGDMTAAAAAWDGEAQIDSTGPLTDHANLQDQRLVFAYGAPTDSDVDAWATAAQAQKAAWHGCPAMPDSSIPMTFGGTPAVLASFTCGGLHVLSLYAVKDGFGLVVNVLNPPGQETEDAAVFERLVADWTWSS